MVLGDEPVCLVIEFGHRHNVYSPKQCRNIVVPVSAISQKLAIYQAGVRISEQPGGHHAWYKAVRHISGLRTIAPEAS